MSLIPAVLAVLSLAVGARDVEAPRGKREAAPKLSFRGLGRPFLTFMFIVGVFDLGNSSDAFLVLRAQERGLALPGILGMLVTSTPSTRRSRCRRGPFPTASGGAG